MTPEEIKNEYVERSQRQLGPGLEKIIQSAQKRGVKDSYELDVMITMFFMNQFLPVLNNVENHMERILDQIREERGFENNDPPYAEATRRFMEEVFSDMPAASKVLVASLFGELDGDPAVEEYITSRAEEFRRAQLSTRTFLEQNRKPNHE